MTSAEEGVEREQHMSAILNALVNGQKKSYGNDRDGQASAEKAVLAKLEACKSASALKRVLDSPECEDVTYGETPLPKRGAEAIAAKVRAWRKPADVAASITWLTRLSAFEPNRVIRPHAQIKEPVACVLEAQRELLRELTGSKAAGVRVAAAHALACCRNTDSDDLAILEAGWSREKNTSALATFVLGAGAVSRRASASERSAIRERAGDLLRHADLVVRLCAVAAMAMSNPDLPDEASSVLSTAVSKAAKLPPQWGWFWLQRRDDTSHFAAELCGWVRLRDRSAIADVLANARDVAPLNDALTDALMRTAFPQVPPSGIALDELDAPQRRAVESLAAHGSYEWEPKLGLWAWKGAARLLEGEHVAWRPLEVRAKAGPRRWHFGKISQALVHEEVALREAVASVAAGLNGPQEVVDVILDAGMAGTEIEQRLVVALYEHLAQNGVDVEAAIADGRERGEREMKLMEALGLLAVYRLRGERLPEQYDELIVEALDDVRTPSPLDELLQQLDPARREHIFIASLEALDWDWEWNGIHVAHIAFTEPIARAVVARTHDVPEQFDGAVGAVTRAGKAGRKLLTRLDLTKSHSATRDKLLAAI